ncbi:hypothetical protein QCE49_14005 [Caballeronia sp. LZ008]|uniref:hypothetical protein n=1 Tax=unclassified Caballeronia TaxID=2646786 RepID=UPI002028D278|nr:MULTISPECIES: hypothetical protein [unclassified Caballeronia]MDR5794491.1 hypothetical protein [Caballeronia sp. LZ008]
MIDRQKLPHGDERPQTMSALMRDLSTSHDSNAAADDVMLFDYFKNLTPPAGQVARIRLEKLLPALALAHANGNSVKSLVDALKVKGINVSAVTLRKKISAYPVVRRDGNDPNVFETV